MPRNPLRVLRAVLILVAAACGILLSLRAILGPFHLAVTINRPINLQGILGLASTLAIVLSACPISRDLSGAPRFLPRDWWLVGGAAALAILGFCRNLPSFFLSDDFYLLSIADRPDHNWRALFVHGGGAEFFRPVGGLLLVATNWFADFSPLRWHAVSLLFHVFNAALVYVLARRLFTARALAWIAAALFAVHGTAAETVAWVAARFDVFATTFILLSLVCFLAQRDSKLAGFRYASLAFTGLAVLTKESAFALPMLLTVALAAEPGISRRDFRSLLPHWILTIALLLVRWPILGGIGGYTDASGRPQALSFDPLKFANVGFLRIWSALYVPVNWSVEPSLLLALLLPIGLAALLWAATTARIDPRAVGVSIAFCVIAALPAMHQLLIGADLQKSRSLYLPLVGFCFLMGVTFGSGRTGRLQTVAVVAFLAFHFACLQHNLAIWRQVASLADAACSEILRQLPADATGIVIEDLPGSINGVYFLRNGIPGCLDLKAGRDLGVPLKQRGSTGDLVLRWNGTQSDRYLFSSSIK